MFFNFEAIFLKFFAKICRASWNHASFASIINCQSLYWIFRWSLLLRILELVQCKSDVIRWL